MSGFTLLELLLTVAALALIGGVSAPAYVSFQNRNNLDIATVTYVQSLRRAQTLAQASDGDSNWGVRAQSGSIILFKGTDYSTRDTTYDETTAIPTSITLGGTLEYVYTKFTGLPLATGSLTLTSVNNEIRTITLNAKGTVTY